MNEKIRSLLETAFAAGWASTGGGVKVVLENDSTPDGADRWLRFTLRWVSGARRNLGQPHVERQRGCVILQIFTPQGEGTKGNDTLLDKASDILREIQLTGDGIQLTTETPQPVTVGTRDDFFQQNLLVFFDADKVFTA